MLKPRLSCLAGLLLLAWAAASPASAASSACRVGNLSQQNLLYEASSYPDPLTAAIEEAQSGDTLQVTGTCRGTFTISKDLTLTGVRATLDAGHAGSVLTISRPVSVALTNLVITNGEPGLVGFVFHGGGITNRGGTVTLTESEVIANTDSIPQAAAVGGGIYNDRGTIDIERSTITGNNVAQEGGGINNYYGVVNVVNSTVSDNRAGGGGAIANRYGTVVVSRSFISRNSGITGGAIYNDGLLRISRSTLSGNTSVPGEGGAVFNNASLDLIESTVIFNTASNGGGAIYNLGALNLNNSAVAFNSAYWGGALYNESLASLNFSRLFGNSAWFGGGVFNTGNLTLNDSVVSRNRATVVGGGLYSSGTVAVEGTSSVCGNTPDDWPSCS